ncbi:MAG: hypothetical protein LBS20_14330 [Prevotella sp.]|nr:hypothetical protein [Prevotella sp.]
MRTRFTMGKKGLYFISISFILLLTTNLIILASVKNVVVSKGYYKVSQREYKKADVLLISDSLYTEWRTDKEFIEEFRLQSLIALSFYPELKDVEIHFKYSNEATTMACRPNFSSLLVGKRVYTIFINNNHNFDGILLADVPFNAQIGVIGHEIAHIIDYEERNTLGIIQIGLNYLNNEDKRDYESSVDRITIQRGLGWQLYDWAQYSMYDSPRATDEYKSFKRDIYLQPQQITEEMQIYSCYQKFFN